MLDDLMPVRIVGEVSRFAFVAVVTDCGDDVRVRWRNRHARTGRAGYLCDQCGHLIDPTACPHALAVSWAVADRRRADAEAAAAAVEAPPGGPPRSAQRPDPWVGLKGAERPIDLNKGDARATTQERR